MPEISLEFIGDTSPWLVPLLVVLAVWGKLNWDALNNPTKKASFDRAVGWLREDSFGQLYLRFLGRLMDRVGDWIGDRQQLSQSSMTVTQPKGLTRRVFGFNPFTAKSYEKCLLLAFMYPVFAYLLAWAMGAEGSIGDTSLFDQRDTKLFTQSDTKLDLWQRWSTIGGTLLFMGSGLWVVLRWQDWKQWLALIVIFVITAMVSNQLASNIAISMLVFSFVLVLLLTFIYSYISGWLTGLLVHRSYKKAHQAIYKLAFTFAAVCAFAVTFSGVYSNSASFSFFSSFSEAFSVAVIVAFSVAVAVTFSVAGAANSAVAVAIAFAIAGTVNSIVEAASIGGGIMMVIVQALQQWSERKRNIRWFWVVYSLFLISLGTASLSMTTNSGYMLFILLWLLLPLVNAPLDWLSLGFTRGLLQAVRTGNHSGWRTLIWAGADLLLAFGFLFLITAILVAVTALGNAVSDETLIDIGCILSKLKADKAHPDHWWIYFMLLSTLIPTLFHFALAGGAATLWLPRKWRTRLADGLEEDMHKTFGAWVYLTFTPVVGFILLPLALLWSLWWLLSTNGGALGTLLLEWATGLAKWADPSMALVCGAG